MEFELVPSGSGPKGPDQFRMILRYKPQATSNKQQAASFKLDSPGIWDYKGFRKREIL